MKDRRRADPTLDRGSSNETTSAGQPGDDRIERWWVRGRVQGVSYRWFTRDAARALGLRGTVRNLSDGRVELFVAGEASRLERLHAHLLEGPPASRVEGIERESSPSTDLPFLPSPFEIRL